MFLRDGRIITKSYIQLIPPTIILAHHQRRIGRSLKLRTIIIIRRYISLVPLFFTRVPAPVIPHKGCFQSLYSNNIPIQVQTHICNRLFLLRIPCCGINTQIRSIRIVFTLCVIQPDIGQCFCRTGYIAFIFTLTCVQRPFEVETYFQTDIFKCMIDINTYIILLIIENILPINRLRQCTLIVIAQ